MRSNPNATLAELVRNRTSNAPVGVYPNRDLVEETPGSLKELIRGAQASVLQQAADWKVDPAMLQRFEDETVDTSAEQAKRGGLQGHSIGEVYPYIVVGIENPGYIPAVAPPGVCASKTDAVRFHKGTFFYVQNPDGTIGSRLYRSAATALMVAGLLKGGHIEPAVLTRADWAEPRV